MIAIYCCTWYFLLFRANCPNTCHQSDVFRRWGCHRKASNLFMGQVASSLKEISYFSIRLPAPSVLFNALPMSPVSCWTAFQTSLAPFPELLDGRQWPDISCSSVTIHLGWLRCLFPIGKSSGGTDHFFLNSLTSKDSSRAPAAESTLGQLLQVGGILCCFSLKLSVFW